jgi:hypothetical protein
MADTNKLAPPPPKLAKPVRKQKRIGRRSSRRTEEDIPSFRYIEQMQKLGPREGESLLAFTKRMAAVKAARGLWLKVWVEQNGDKEAAAEAAGIPRNNLAYELRLVGLSSELLDEHFAREVGKKR